MDILGSGFLCAFPRFVWGFLCGFFVEKSVLVVEFVLSEVGLFGKKGVVGSRANILYVFPF